MAEADDSWRTILFHAARQQRRISMVTAGLLVDGIDSQSWGTKSYLFPLLVLNRQITPCCLHCVQGGPDIVASHFTFFCRHHAQALLALAVRLMTPLRKGQINEEEWIVEMVNVCGNRHRSCAWNGE